MTKVYTGANLDRVAFPLGGIGAGTICLEGTGTLSHVSIRHRPEVNNEPGMFAALYVKGSGAARVVEGPVPRWKILGAKSADMGTEPGNGLRGRTYGLPRFSRASFSARFPFAAVELADPAMPVKVALTGWSPFIPGDADDSSLPSAALEYRFRNVTKRHVEGVFSFHVPQFVAAGREPNPSVQSIEGGFVLCQPRVPEKPWLESCFAVLSTDPAVRANCAWFRGGWVDAATMVWRSVAAGEMPSGAPYTEGTPSPGGSIYVPFRLAPGAERLVPVLVAWYVPQSDLRLGKDPETGGQCARDGESHYRPWYAGRFANIREVADYWRSGYSRLRRESARFSDCFHDTSMPEEMLESAAANLGILKSPTVLRQADGRIWAWEGCHDASGCCHGSCTHVWNYAQALPHLFPSLERTLRETEFLVSQDEKGHQNFRASLPVRPPPHDFHAAADGQLGGIMKLHREWRISGDTAWMKRLWPAAKKSLDYCVATWDPDRTGTLVEPHHNTYDIEFWGPDGMCTSFYLGALSAAVVMGRECGTDMSAYEALLEKGRRAMESGLWNGEYFHQRVRWTDLRAGDPAANQSWTVNYSPEAKAILLQEGPKYQYGDGCLADGILGDWIARCCGVETGIDPLKVRRHLGSVFRYNFRRNLREHVNAQRPGYALGDDGGLVLCTWPLGRRPALPFPYSDEVWTGFEYQVASHLMMMGDMKNARAIVKTLRKRHDGRWRNPFDEYECGHWYARAMSSYGLLQAYTGARYDAETKTLHVAGGPKGDRHGFICTEGGYGTVGVRKGKPFLTVQSGRIAVRRVVRERDNIQHRTSNAHH